MRTPDAGIIPTVPNLELLQLDVADPASIAQAVAAAGEIVVLVNHAGIGWLNALEGTPMDAACGGNG
jgi:NAD(P)-dependent dehydrogenase (short-subunit alcohol dehydrogenase family)